MSINPFRTIGDYPNMLNKIAISTFIASIVSVTIIRSQITSVDEFLKTIDLFSIPVPLLGIPLSLGSFVTSLMIAILSRMIKFHDKISDVFKIRERFDICEILLPLAVSSPIELTRSQIDSIKRKRKDLMYKVFYKYASSGSDAPVIDRHFITMALDQWSWYWMVLEWAAILFLTSMLILLFGENPHTSISLLLIVFGLIALLQILRRECSKYALQEVEQIVNNPGRKMEIAEVFRAL